MKKIERKIKKNRNIIPIKKLSNYHKRHDYPDDLAILI